MLHVIAFAAVLATPAPRPTLPPVIYHVIAQKANPRKACGIYRFRKAVRIQGGAQLVVCDRPKGALYF